MARWMEKPLGELTSYIAKGIPPKYTDELNEDSIYVLNQKCNRDFTISYEQARLHDSAVKSVPDDKMLRPGDVLINSTGEGTAGRVAQIWDVPHPTTTDGHVILMRPTVEIDPLYYGYAIKAFQSRIETLAEGSTGQTEINKRRLQDEIIISYPADIEVQHKVANILEIIDKKIHVNKAINDNLSQLAQLFFSTWFKENDFDTLQKVPLSEATSSIIRGKTTKYVDSSDLINLNQKVNKGAVLEKQYYKYLDPSISVPLEKYACKKDILLNSLGFGTLGRIHFYHEETSNVVIDQHITIIRSLENVSTPEYLYLLLSSGDYSNYFESCVTGSTGMQMLNISAVRDTPVPLPTIEQQEYLSQIVSPLYEMIYRNTHESESLVIIRDTLLPKLMSGELDVSNLDL